MNSQPPANRKVQLASGSVILTLLVATLLLLGALSYHVMIVTRESDRWVRHTHEVLEHLQDLFAAMQTAESSYRGFLMTGGEQSLKPYRDSLLRSGQETNIISNLTADNLAQQQQIPSLVRLSNQKIQYAEGVMNVRRTEGMEAAANSLRDGESQRLLDEYRDIILEMETEETRLLLLRDVDAKGRLDETRNLLILGTTLGLLIAVAASRSVQRDNSRRGLAEDALFLEKERAQVTLNCIGDAVICTDIAGGITFLNIVAEKMTGWPWKEAAGRPMAEVFRIIDGTTRQAGRDPMMMSIEQNKTVGLTANCVLIRRDGCEYAIEDSASPIHDRTGRIIGAVIVFHDVSATRAMSLQIEYSAHHDFVTNLPNRILLNDRITQTISLASRNNRSIALLFLDLDHFKYVNDSLGHPIGDLLLQCVSMRLQTSVRGSDTVSRQGGDEFVILLSEITHPEHAATSAMKILHSLSLPYSIDGHDLHIDGSIGISIYPTDGTEAETLIKNADTAMYYAKETGRNNFQFFTAEMNLKSVRRQSLESSLRRAIERDEFLLHYQPQVSLVTGEITGVEDLIRWQHPDRGLVPPGQFVPIAEDCGLILPIGRWVLREACRQACGWQAANLPFKRISVNVSAAEFRNKDFVKQVATTLEETGLESRYLDLELTEGVLMADAKSTGAILHALKNLGVHLAVDDFGTGYSSLSYLRQFPIDVLKIDQSFVRQVTADPDDSTIASAIIDIGKSLKQRVIAEGIETQAEVAFLQARHCAEGQGYLFSQPWPAVEFVRLLKIGCAESVIH